MAEDNKIINLLKQTVEGKKVVTNTAYGYSGTDIYSGYISEDYNRDWDSIEAMTDTVELMVKGDSTIAAILDALKDPLLSARWYVQGENEKMVEMVHENLFEKCNFQDFLVQVLSYLEYGFSVFEKVYKVENGRIYVYPQQRLQRTIKRWDVDNLPWVDGHPQGITQEINTTDEVQGKPYNVTIPWGKILRFTFRQQGNNFRGESILRRSYGDYKLKNLLYKISGISAERFGVGIPYIKYRANSASSPQNIQKYEEMLANLRSNEKGYAIFSDEVEEFEIKTPSGSGSNQLIKDMVQFHNQQLYTGIKAGFLNLTTGDGGSNALSKDQSSFFLRGLESHSNYICGVMNELIKELCYLNFNTTEDAPKLCVSDIGSISMDEYTQSLSMATSNGLLTWGEKDEEKLREQLRLPEREEERDATIQPTKKDVESPKEEVEEEEEDKALSEVEESFALFFDAVGDGNISLLPKKQKQSAKRLYTKKKRLWTETDAREAKKIVNIISLASTPQLQKPTKREVAFMNSIQDYENYLASMYDSIVSKVEKYEGALTRLVQGGYKKMETERIDGVVKLKPSAKNNALANKLVKAVGEIEKRMKDELINSKIQERLFDKTIKMAKDTIGTNDKLLAEEVRVNKAKFNSFIKGYISNVEGVIFNDNRRVKETIIDATNGASLELALEQAGKIKFNRNILKLSTITHPRGAFNGIIYDDAVNNGFTMFKVLAPKSKLKTMSTKGLSFNMMFLILTAAEITRRANEAAGEDKVVSSTIDGLNIHHGAFLYFLPMPSDEIAEQRTLISQQRKDLESTILANQQQ